MSVQETERRQRVSNRLIADCIALLGKRYVLHRPEELATYECDACTLVQGRPDIVVLPATSAQVQALVQLCLKHKMPYIARGSGTGLSGGALAIEGGMMISLNRLNQVEFLDPANRYATIQAGVVNTTLNREAGVHGLCFAPDPSSQTACTIGGNIAENAGGIHCIKYGVTTDHILALEVVFPDGRMAWVGQPTRQVQGLNLVGLLVGSEGTLGVITRARVRLSPLPEATRVYLAAFDTVESATQSVSEIIAKGLQPAALEFMDAFTIKAVNQAFDVGFPETSDAVILVELDGPSTQIQQDEPKLLAILNANGATRVDIGATEAERKALWAARKGAVAAYGRYYPAFYLHDCVIPRSKLTQVLRGIQAIGREYDLPVGNVFHAGDGNLHPNLLFNPEDPAMVQRVLKAGDAILRLCLDAGGTLSGEHGIGIEKAHFMDLQFQPQDLAKMTDLKALFDPSHLANPGKIFPVRAGCGETSLGLRHAQLTAAASAGEESLWI